MVFLTGLTKQNRIMTQTNKRFYETVTVEKNPDDTYGVRLDGKPVKTPMGNRLASPSTELMDAVAAEWDAQKDDIRPEDMPLTQLLNTAIDRVKPNPMQIIDAVLEFMRAELVCYRADEDVLLAQRQEGIWSGLLDWMDDHYNVRLKVTKGIQHIEQDPEVFDVLRGQFSTFSNEWLTALQAAVGVTGSLVISLALLEGRLDAENAFQAAELDALYQAEQWGLDELAKKRHDAMREELEAAKDFAELAGL